MNFSDFQNDIFFGWRPINIYCARYFLSKATCLQYNYVEVQCFHSHAYKAITFYLSATVNSDHSNLSILITHCLTYEMSCSLTLQAIVEWQSTPVFSQLLLKFLPHVCFKFSVHYLWLSCFETWICMATPKDEQQAYHQLFQRVFS